MEKYVALLSVPIGEIFCKQFISYNFWWIIHLRLL